MRKVLGWFCLIVGFIFVLTLSATLNDLRKLYYKGSEGNLVVLKQLSVQKNIKSNLPDKAKVLGQIGQFKSIFILDYIHFYLGLEGDEKSLPIVFYPKRMKPLNSFNLNAFSGNHEGYAFFVCRKGNDGFWAFYKRMEGDTLWSSIVISCRLFNFSCKTV